MSTGRRFESLLEIMDKLRDPGGCPWDAEQTMESLQPYLIEEAYECLEAMESGDRAAQCEELGDLLLQVVFQSRIAKEEQAFSVDEVIEGICDKLVRRHPHVFAELLFPAKEPDYPYPTGQRQLRHLRDRVGAEKLLWGSDSPFGTATWCTYRQSLDFIRLHCDFLSADEKDLILGGNAARLFGIEPLHPD